VFLLLTLDNLAYFVFIAAFDFLGFRILGRRFPLLKELLLLGESSSGSFLVALLVFRILGLIGKFCCELSFSLLLG
jgi:hypothetical protein